MKIFKNLAKDLVKKIDDPIERKVSSEELYSYMLDMYDEFIESNLNEEEAIKKVVENFNDVSGLKESYKSSHIHSVNKNKLILFIFITFVVFILLYLFIYSIFA